MIYALLLSAVMADPASTDSKAADIAAYKEARANAGRDADAHVRLALWCEARGMDAERTKHLTIAALIDPQHAAARGLLGMIQHQGKWLSPDALAQQLRDDPEQQAKVKEYLARRARAADTADDQVKLALWCEENGLKDQATAHFHRAVRLDPGRELAWRHLGYKKEKGRWAKPEQLAAEKEMLELQLKANKHWRPILEKLRNGLSSKHAAEREKAQAALDGIKDPAAVPMIWAMFAQGDVRRQEIALKLLGQIDAPGASKALAMLAVTSRSQDVRRNAVERLRRKDPRDFADVLISMIRKPIEYEVRAKVGTSNSGELFVKGKDQNWRRIFSPLSMPEFATYEEMLATDGVGDQLIQDSRGYPVIRRIFNAYSPFGTAMGTNSNLYVPQLSMNPPDAAAIASTLTRGGLSPKDAEKLGTTFANNVTSNMNAFANIYLGGGALGMLGPDQVAIGGVEPRFYVDIPLGEMARDVQNSARAAQMQLDDEVKRIEAYNRPIRDINRQARQILSDTTGVDLGDDPAKWQSWYLDILGLATPTLGSATQVTTTVEEIPIDYIPTADTSILRLLALSPLSCFGAGTSVRTEEGLQPIESLRVGDMVLTQNVTSGQISFSPVLIAYHNPPNNTLKIRFDGPDKPVVATGIHRFWKVGESWVMARDLKPGDALRAIGGVARVAAVEPDSKQPVFNLRVAEGESFFVGDLGVLAHDNSLVNTAAKPFDRIDTQDKAADRD